ncbi:MAG TPA: response regulator transcription factor [Candidatus Acidoferrum sp.]|nr:response regulator transcription factor [Candidatus Acidoferrum sp.]
MPLAVRILLVDDFKPWRFFVSSLLQKNPDWQIVCEASDGMEALQKAEKFQPDLILLDIGLPRLNGIEAALSIRELSPRSKILFLSENRSSEVAAAALSAGGHGYAVKSDGADELLLAVEAVLLGKRFVSNTFAGVDFATAEGQSRAEFR